MVNNEAIEAAAKAVYELTFAPANWDAEEDGYKDDLRESLRVALEAAEPILLSHEREETRLAHLDAVVNRDTADRLEQELETAKVAAWEEGKDAVWSYLSNQDPRRERPTNPYRSE